MRLDGLQVLRGDQGRDLGELYAGQKSTLLQAADRTLFVKLIQRIWRARDSLFFAG